MSLSRPLNDISNTNETSRFANEYQLTGKTLVTPVNPALHRGCYSLYLIRQALDKPSITGCNAKQNKEML